MDGYPVEALLRIRLSRLGPTSVSFRPVLLVPEADRWRRRRTRRRRLVGVGVGVGQMRQRGRRRRRRRRRWRVVCWRHPSIVSAPPPGHCLREQHQVVKAVVHADAVPVHDGEPGRDSPAVALPQQVLYEPPLRPPLVERVGEGEDGGAAPVAVHLGPSLERELVHQADVTLVKQRILCLEKGGKERNERSSSSSRSTRKVFSFPERSLLSLSLSFFSQKEILSPVLAVSSSPSACLVFPSPFSFFLDVFYRYYNGYRCGYFERTKCLSSAIRLSTALLSPDNGRKGGERRRETC